MARKQKVVDNLFNGLRSLLRSRKVTIVDGVGRLAGEGTVAVEGPDGTTTELQGRHVILAAGSVPRTLPGFDIDGRLVVTSDELLSIEQLPASAVVVGGGAIGCEFASMMSDLGTEVTILEALPKILPGCDKDVADLVVRSFKKRGITIRTGVQVTGHTPKEDGSGTVVHLGGQGQTDDGGPPT